MKHKMVSSRSSGQDGWSIKCSCGWRTSGWRWLCEERFLEHSTPEPKDTWGGYHSHNAYIAGAPNDDVELRLSQKRKGG